MGEARHSTAQRPVGDQIETVMGEFRVILPALGVLFGFQLTIAFSSGFDDLPRWLRMVNFAALVSTAIAIVFMLAPASYHRFTRGLDESYGYLHMAQRNAGGGFAFLALSLVLSVFVQAQESFGSVVFSAAAAAGLGALLGLGWWVMPLVRARRRGTYGRKWLPHDDPDEREAQGSARSWLRE